MISRDYRQPQMASNFFNIIMKSWSTCGSTSCLLCYFILGSFHETCIKMGLTENDDEAEEALAQAHCSESAVVTN